VNPLVNRLLRIAWRSRIAQRVSARKPLVLMYHGVPLANQPDRMDAARFAEHVRFLKAHFEVISVQEYLTYRPGKGRVPVVLTFDDGYRNNCSVVAPILRRYNVPALFFVCRRHATAGHYLWNTHLVMLRERFPEKGFAFRGKFRSLEPSARETTLDLLLRELYALKPYPQAMYDAIATEFPPLESFVEAAELADRCAGLTEQHIAEMAQDKLFTFGVHTLDHAVLTECSDEEAVRQMSEGRQWLEGVIGRPCNLFAYPNGAYAKRTLAQVAEVGFTHSFAVRPVLRISQILELPRVGIYRPSLDIVGFKVVFGRLIRRMGLRLG